MGEKGNLVDMGEEIFASLAEQGPQFWIAYEQYKESRSRSGVTQPRTVLRHGEGAQEHAAQSPRRPAAG